MVYASFQDELEVEGGFLYKPSHWVDMCPGCQVLQCWALKHEAAIIVHDDITNTTGGYEIQARIISFPREDPPDSVKRFSPKQGEAAIGLMMATGASPSAEVKTCSLEKIDEDGRALVVTVPCFIDRDFAEHCMEMAYESLTLISDYLALCWSS